MEEWACFIMSGELHFGLKNELADRGCVVHLSSIILVTRRYKSHMSSASC